MILNTITYLPYSLVASVSFSFFCLNQLLPFTPKVIHENDFIQNVSHKDDINIFFAVNDAYAKQLSVTIVSILENNQDEKIHFYIMSNDFSELNKRALENIKKKYKNWNITFLQPNKKLFENLNLTIKYITIEIYYRYVIAQMLPNLNKALYLDADLAVNGPLRSLWDTPLQGYYCAGVRDLCIERLDYKKTIGLDESDLYINGGMLLLNLGKIRQDNMTNKLFENTIRMSGIIFYQDQDIINITFKNKIKEVDSIYNFTSDNLKKEKSKASKAVIIHYTGATKKPWKENCHSKLQYIWQCYARLNEAIQSLDENELLNYQVQSCSHHKNLYFRKVIKFFKKVFFYV